MAIGNRGRRRISVLLWMTLFCFAASGPALATSCKNWNRMSEEARYDRIAQMIDDALSGQGGRSYKINRNAVGRCLVDNTEDMYWSFTDMCSDSTTGGMNSIRKRFKQFIWTCIN